MIFLVAALTIVIDQLSKYVINATIAEGSSVTIIEGLLYLTHVRNSGAAFGLFPNQPMFLIAVSAFIIVSIVTYYLAVRPRSAILRLALGLELGGAVGNLVDRLITGTVTDFLDLNKMWPVFNLADSAIVIGAAALCLTVLFCREPRRTTAGKVGE